MDQHTPAPAGPPPYENRYTPGILKIFADWTP